MTKIEDEMAALKRAAEANPDDFLLATVGPIDDDFRLIGLIVQSYCFTDLNARRAIDALRYMAEGPEARDASWLRDAQVLPALRGELHRLPSEISRPRLEAAVDIYEMHAVLRHTFAHWAARRIVGHDYLIVYTKNAKEGQRRDGVSQSADQMKFGLVPMKFLKEEVVKLEAHGLFLAETAAYLEALSKGQPAFLY